MAEIADDDAEREPALAAFPGAGAAAPVSSDDPEDRLAYDGSDGAQQRPLAADERALLHRVIGMVSGHPAWRTAQVVRRPEIGAAIGDGTRPQGRDLNARERDDLCRMVMIVTGEFRDQFRGPGREPRYNGTLTSGEIARLNLIAEVISPREDYSAPPLRVNEEDWAPPAAVPAGWQVAAARRPLDGPVTWQGADLGNGEFYAAIPPDADPDSLGWDPRDPADGARWVVAASNGQVADAVHIYLAQYGCGSPAEAGLTVAEAARDLALPWRARRRGTPSASCSAARRPARGPAIRTNRAWRCPGCSPTR